MVAQVETIRRDCINLRRMIVEQRQALKRKVEGELEPAQNILGLAEQRLEEVRHNPASGRNDLTIAQQRVRNAKTTVRGIEAVVQRLRAHLEDLERHFNISGCRRILE